MRNMKIWGALWRTQADVATYNGLVTGIIPVDEVAADLVTAYEMDTSTTWMQMTYAMARLIPGAPMWLWRAMGEALIKYARIREATLIDEAARRARVYAADRQIEAGYIMRRRSRPVCDWDYDPDYGWDGDDDIDVSF